ncbi:MAG: 23S rRNA (adenine(2503)-C(2))-methyltransferase RlmN [Phycisphaeraceae bacterium]|nr:23S rRNA (adenine(2503)-C(2))-methyltransferase RlmN [Phycisphaeraceae bacterium]
MRHPSPHIFEFTPESLGDWCESGGKGTGGERGCAMPRFRAKQILDWVYAKGITDPSAMTNLSKADRTRLSSITFLSGFVVREQRASDDTRKLLIQWHEAQSAKVGGRQTGVALPMLNANEIHGVPLDARRQTECVMIPADRDEAGGADNGAVSTVYKRRTACISSQVGCPVGCRFCASGLGGLDGNLSPGRIVEQVYRLARLLDSPGEPGTGRITNVVFMGMGEPLSNFAAVTHAVRTLAAPWGMGISARKITISTVGLPKAIERLANELDLPVTLALSLHAPNDAIRRELIPWAEYTTIADLLDACWLWFNKTGREITLEYILLRGVNDRPEHARELARVAKSLRANVNLIRYNEVGGLPFGRPEDDDVLTFQSVLRQAGVNSHIRASRGRDIAAACGQLRHEKAPAPIA